MRAAGGVFATALGVSGVLHCRMPEHGIQSEVSAVRGAGRGWGLEETRRRSLASGNFKVCYRLSAVRSASPHPAASTPVGPLPEGEGNCVSRVSNRTV